MSARRPKHRTATVRWRPFSPQTPTCDLPLPAPALATRCALLKGVGYAHRPSDYGLLNVVRYGPKSPTGYGLLNVVRYGPKSPTGSGPRSLARCARKHGNGDPPSRFAVETVRYHYVRRFETVVCLGCYGPVSARRPQPRRDEYPHRGPCEVPRLDYPSVGRNQSLPTCFGHHWHRHVLVLHSDHHQTSDDRRRNPAYPEAADGLRRNPAAPDPVADHDLRRDDHQRSRFGRPMIWSRRQRYDEGARIHRRVAAYRNPHYAPGPTGLARCETSLLNAGDRSSRSGTPRPMTNHLRSPDEADHCR